MTTIEVRTHTPEQTRRVGSALAHFLEPGDLVLLSGTLGAGKTTLVKGVAVGLGVVENVTSPTFVLLRPYSFDPTPSGIRTLLHADLYRLDHLQEVVDLAIGDMVEESAVALVEWGDVGEPVLGYESLRVLIEEGSDEEERIISLTLPDPWQNRAVALDEQIHSVSR